MEEPHIVTPESIKRGGWRSTQSAYIGRGKVEKGRRGGVGKGGAERSDKGELLLCHDPFVVWFLISATARPLTALYLWFPTCLLACSSQMILHIRVSHKPWSGRTLAVNLSIVVVPSRMHIKSKRKYVSGKTISGVKL